MCGCACSGLSAAEVAVATLMPDHMEDLWLLFCFASGVSKSERLFAAQEQLLFQPMTAALRLTQLSSEA